MKIQEYKNIFDNETSHFYYITNHEIILSLLKKYLPKNQHKLKILDAGCGTGLLAKKLEQFGFVTGLDISPEAIKFAKSRIKKLVRGSVDKLPFDKNTFDAVTSLDVIYHKAVNDKKALGEFLRVLKPGGILILRVPAIKWLNLKHDKYVHTRERYSKQELIEKLQNTGFLIQKVSFVNSVLLPLAILNQLKEKVFDEKIKSGISKTPKFTNALLTCILSLENKILNRTSLPFGLGIVAVAIKPQAIK